MDVVCSDPWALLVENAYNRVLSVAHFGHVHSLYTVSHFTDFKLTTL